MRALALVLPTSLLLAAACSHPHPAPMISSGPVPPATQAPPEAALELELDGVRWYVSVPGGTVSSTDEYHRKVEGPGYALDITGWPDSDAFVQTLAEHLDSYKEKGKVDIIHQVDGGRGKFEAVLHVAGTYDGTVLVPHGHDGTDGGMCSFTLPDSTDWHAALSACQSLVPANYDDSAVGNDGCDPAAGDDCGGGNPCGGYDDSDGSNDDDGDDGGDPCGD